MNAQDLRRIAYEATEARDAMYARVRRLQGAKEAPASACVEYGASDRLADVCGGAHEAR
jgi:hypothetical protein